MGYYTYHTINVGCDNDDTIKEIVEAMKSKEIIPYVFNEYLEPQDITKWYEEPEEMKAISAMFPEILFCIHGEGEEGGDLWDAYYLGGKRQYCPATITYDDFDPSKLE